MAAPTERPTERPTESEDKMEDKMQDLVFVAFNQDGRVVTTGCTEYCAGAGRKRAASTWIGNLASDTPDLAAEITEVAIILPCIPPSHLWRSDAHTVTLTTSTTVTLGS